MEIGLIFEKAQSVISKGLAAFVEKSQNLTQQDMISLAVLGIVGLLFCFVGLKMVRFWAAVLGLLAGVAGGTFAASYFGLDDIVSMIIGLVLGIILAALAAKFYLAGVMLVGWGLGIAVSVYFIQPTDWIYTIVCVAIGLVVGLIVLKFAEPATMVLTGLFGGFTAGQAIYGVIPLENTIIRIALPAVLTILGVVVQFLLESKRRKRLHLKKAAEIRSRHSTANEVDKARAMMENLESEAPAKKSKSMSAPEQKKTNKAEKSSDEAAEDLQDEEIVILNLDDDE